MIWPGEDSTQRVSVGRAGTDEWIADRLEASVRCDPRIRGHYLEIQVQNRVVLLFGELASSEACTAARLLAWSVPGVVDVRNRVTVSCR